MAAKLYFPRVKEAREALAAEAVELVKLQKQLILEAAAAGSYDAALKANQWLLEHMPKEDGSTVIDESAAKPKQIVEGNKGPSVQIGVVLGGMTSEKKLRPAIREIVDTKVVEDKE